MYETAMTWLFNCLYDCEPLTDILALNVEVPTRDDLEGNTVPRAAIYDSNQPTNSKAPFVVLTPEMQPQNNGHWAMANAIVTIDIFTDETSSLTAAKIFEIITAEIEFQRESVDGNIYRTFSNNDLLNVPDEDREEISHLSFTITLRYVRQDYAEIFGK